MSNYSLEGFISVTKECFIENVIGFNTVKRFEDNTIMEAVYNTDDCILISIKNKQDSTVKFYLKTI